MAPLSLALHATRDLCTKPEKYRSTITKKKGSRRYLENCIRFTVIENHPKIGENCQFRPGFGRVSEGWGSRKVGLRSIWVAWCGRQACRRVHSPGALAAAAFSLRRSVTDQIFLYIFMIYLVLLPWCVWSPFTRTRVAESNNLGGLQNVWIKLFIQDIYYFWNYICVQTHFCGFYCRGNILKRKV